MQNFELRYLSQQDILDLDISWGTIIDRVELALKEHGEKTVENPPKPGAHSRPQSFIHAMPAYLEQMDAVGLKWISGYPANFEKKIPTIIGLLIMNDPETGVPTAVMDSTWITAVRTAAVSAVSAKCSARRDSKVLGIVGAGVQGRMNAYAVKHVVPGIEEIKIFDIFTPSMENFKEEIERELNVKVTICDSTKGIATDADIIVTTTPRNPDGVKPEWLIKRDWINKEGVLALPVDGTRSFTHGCLYSADMFVTDDIKQTTMYHEVHGVFPDGLPEVYAELGEQVIGEKTGRDHDEQFIVSLSNGLAIEDISMGKFILELAEQQNVGTMLPL